MHAPGLGSCTRVRFRCYIIACQSRFRCDRSVCQSRGRCDKSDCQSQVRCDRGSSDPGWVLGAHFLWIEIERCRSHAPFETCPAPSVSAISSPGLIMIWLQIETNIAPINFRTMTCQYLYGKL